MTLTSAHWTYAIDPGIQGNFELGATRRAQLRTALFGIRNSFLATEEIFGSGAIAVDAWDTYEMTGNIPQTDFDQGYKKTFTHKEYPLELQIQRKLYDDAQFANIFNLAMKLGDSAALKMEYDAVSVFNNAFTDTAPYAGADAVGLCSTAHPNSPHATGTTQSNEGTLSLNATNIATVREAMMAFTDDKGQKVGVMPNAILVPPQLEDEALVAVGTPQQPGGANNDLNPQLGRFAVIPWHYLTDANAWFMLDTNLMQQHLLWFNRAPLSVLPKVEDKTIRATWIAYMRYSYGWTDWRWVYGNNPS